MTQAQIAEKNPVTDLTCWKCGEEALTEAPGAAAESVPVGAPDVSTRGRYSICGKCGARSVDAAQARHNKMASKKVRKARIRESNRSLA